jgi:hypothetical protein
VRAKDGFLFLKEMGGQLPSNVSSWSLTNRRLLSAVCLEVHGFGGASTVTEAPPFSPEKAGNNGTGEEPVGYTTPGHA